MGPGQTISCERRPWKIFAHRRASIMQRMSSANLKRVDHEIADTGSDLIRGQKTPEAVRCRPNRPLLLAGDTAFQCYEASRLKHS